MADHHRKRPFVADLILYDKLVIPVPPQKDDTARKEWQRRQWRPGELEDCVGAIKDVNDQLVWDVPWVPDSDVFESRWKAVKDVACDTHNLAETRKIDPDRPAYHVTRKILEGVARDPKNWCDLGPGVWVDPMAAYPSQEAFARDVTVEVGQLTARAEEGTLAGVFGWQFVVPEDRGLDDLALLGEAAQLASDADFRKKRRDFHEWRRKVIVEGVTDMTAVEAMEALVRDYGEAVRNAGIKTKTLYGFAVVGIGLGIAASLGVGAAGIAAAFLAAGSFGAARWIPGGEPEPDQRAAAMFHDARKHFGWR